MRPRHGRRLAAIGCRDGGLSIALALANPLHVTAGFDADANAIAAARRAAARHGVSDRVTFEVAPRGHLFGSGYDVVVILARASSQRRGAGRRPPR